jgi:hypothetical protein
LSSSPHLHPRIFARAKPSSSPATLHFLNSIGRKIGDGVDDYGSFAFLSDLGFSAELLVIKVLRTCGGVGGGGAGFMILWTGDSVAFGVLILTSIGFSAGDNEKRINKATTDINVININPNRIIRK